MNVSRMTVHSFDDLEIEKKYLTYSVQYGWVTGKIYSYDPVEDGTESSFVLDGIGAVELTAIRDFYDLAE